MEDNFEFLNSSDEESELINRFESFVESGLDGYFDPSDLEEIIDIYLSNEQPDMAQKALDLGMKLHPNNALMILKLGQFQFESGALKDSLESANNCLLIEPLLEEAILLKAQIYMQLEDRLTAIKYLRQASEICDPADKPSLLIDIANEYQIEGEIEKSILELKDLLNEFPKHSEALYELAFCYDLSGQYDESIFHYNTYLDQEPYAFVAWYNLGNVFCKKSDFENAISAFDFAIAIKDDLSSAYFNKANALSHLGRYHQAIETFEEAIEHEGCQAITLNYIGECYEKLGEYSKAFSYYEHASEIDPELAEPYIGMGIIKDIEGKPEEALPYMKTAVDMDPENAANWVMLGNAQEKCNMIDKAENSYQTSLKIATNIPEAYLDYANMLSELKRYKEAIDLLMDAIVSCPESKDLFEYRLAAYLFTNGQQNEALGYLEDALQLNYNGHKDLMAYCPDLLNRTEVVKLIENYTNK